MGNLTRTPYSEVTATLERFEHLGVTGEHLTRVRSDQEYARHVVTVGFNGEVIRPDRAPVSFQRQLEQFERFAHEWLGDKQGLGSLPSVSEFADDHTRVLALKPEWTCDRLMQAVREHLPPKPWQFSPQLDATIAIDKRATRPDGPYIVLCRDREVGDKELKNVKVLDLEERGGTYLLPREVILFQLLYSWETGEHLDPKTLTFCPFTRADGCAVFVRWGGRLDVFQYYVDDACGFWRARSAKVLGL
jgi:hypothetical protein